jgi:hypothetical protein
MRDRTNLPSFSRFCWHSTQTTAWGEIFSLLGGISSSQSSHNFTVKFLLMPTEHDGNATDSKSGYPDSTSGVGTSTCSRCKVEKPLKDFSVSRHGPCGFCRLCMKEYHKEHYKKNRDKYRARLAKNRVAIYEIARTNLDDLKRSTPCTDCNTRYHPYLMEFDHVRGQKRANVVRMIQNGATWAVLLEEIKKCDLVCCNCHALRTYSRLPPRIFRRNDEIRTRIRMRELKSKPCMDCSTLYQPEQMQWDHRPGEIKLFRLARAASAHIKWEKVEAEIKKCDLVCGNCHALRTLSRNSL